MSATKTSLPTLTDEQRVAALEKAKASRVFRAQLKKDIGNGTVDIADLIKGELGAFSEDEAALVNKTRVLDLLKAVRGVGAVRAAELMNQVDINERRRLGGLGARQREALVDKLSVD